MKKYYSTLFFAFCALSGAVFSSLVAQGQNPLSPAPTAAERDFMNNLRTGIVDGGKGSENAARSALAQAVGNENLTGTVVSVSLGLDNTLGKRETLLQSLTVLQQQRIIEQNERILQALERIAKK